MNEGMFGTHAQKGIEAHLVGVTGHTHCLALGQGTVFVWCLETKLLSKT